MQETAIQWTDFSANPIKYRDGAGNVVWGCVKCSPGCANCYSEATAERFKRGGPFTRETMAKLTPFLDEKEAKSMLNSRKIAGKRVFVGDMTDVCGEWVPDEMIDQLFAIFALRRDVIWQVLTKRADRLRAYMASRSKKAQYWKDAARTLGWSLEFEGFSLVPFPLPNVWLGVSVEDQPRADERIPLLLQTPAKIRFLSCEPLLGPLDLSEWLYLMKVEHNGDGDTQEVPCRPDIHWIIAGGESGSAARMCDVAWIESVVNQCRQSGVPCFVKQDSDRKPGQQGRLSLATWSAKEFPCHAIG